MKVVLQIQGKDRASVKLTQVFSAVIVIVICFLVVGIVRATAPNPGHNFTEVGGGVAQGDLLYGSAADTLSALGKNTTASVYLSNTGTSNNPAWAQVNLANGVTGSLPVVNLNSGTGATANTLWHGNATWSAVNIASADITGILPIANGGTNANLTLANGGIIYSTASAFGVSAAGSSGQILQSAGAASPTWSTATYPATAGTSGNILEANGTNWVSAAGGVLTGHQVLTSGTTYTPTAGTNKIMIELWGGGGAGGSCTNVAGCASGGGGAGGYARYFLSGVTGTYTIAIGSGGTAVAGAAGNAGGNTTFNTGSITITALGGGGGSFTAGTAATKYTAGGAGGAISTNGNFNGAGAPGGWGSTSATVTIGATGAGGSTSLGGGGVGKVYTSAAAVAGIAATANSGSGGSGGGTGTTATAAGGAGAAGLIIVWEYR